MNDKKREKTHELADILWELAKRWQRYDVVDERVIWDIKELASKIHYEVEHPNG